MQIILKNKVRVTLSDENINMSQECNNSRYPNFISLLEVCGLGLNEYMSSNKCNFLKNLSPIFVCHGQQKTIEKLQKSKSP